MRRIIHVPIIHSLADLGSAAERLEEQFKTSGASRSWEEHVREVEQRWDVIRHKLLALPLEYSRVKLYQDGLPECGRELEIVRDLANSGSQNCRLLCELHLKGAQIMGTEDGELLVEEYKRIRRRLDHSPAEAPGQTPTADSFYDELVARRDAHIAKRIDFTLGAGETGILFLGAAHRILDLLANNIAVSSLL
ncbi:MAG: hypothetical protein AABZ38_00305 [candidate division NC10 bacterium]